MHRIAAASYSQVTVDRAGVVSHAGTALLGELADRVGLTAAFGDALAGLRLRRAGHDPGRVLVDRMVAIADGGEAICELRALTDQPALHGPATSPATAWAGLAAVDDDGLGSCAPCGRLRGSGPGERGRS